MPGLTLPLSACHKLTILFKRNPGRLKDICDEIIFKIRHNFFCFRSYAADAVGFYCCRLVFKKQ